MDNSIKDIVGLFTAKGDVGIEIEVEAKRRLPNLEPELGSIWRSEPDHSLRGYSNEYVMNTPVKIEEVGKHLDFLKERIQLADSKPKYSERAGVHVHLNMQEMTKHQVFATALTYYSLEKALVRFCGPNRQGNHFCLRVSDAEFVLELFEDAIRTDNIFALDTEDIRYASLNFCSLFRYGSLEFRAMETQPDFSKIEEWARMLVAIREYAKKLDRFDKIPEEISGYGPSTWAKNILGDELFRLIDYPEFDMEVMRCMRPLQHLYYSKRAK